MGKMFFTFAFLVLSLFSLNAHAQVANVRINGGSNNLVGTTAAQRLATAQSLINAYQAQYGQFSGMRDVRIDWADAFSEVYRYFPPEDGDLLVWKRLIYPGAMVSGGAGYYRYYGGGVWSIFSSNCSSCIIYYGEVGTPTPAPPKSEP